MASTTLTWSLSFPWMRRNFAASKFNSFLLIRVQLWVFNAVPRPCHFGLSVDCSLIMQWIRPPFDAHLPTQYFLVVCPWCFWLYSNFGFGLVAIWAYLIMMVTMMKGYIRRLSLPLRPCYILAPFCTLSSSSFVTKKTTILVSHRSRKSKYTKKPSSHALFELLIILQFP